MRLTEQRGPDVQVYTRLQERLGLKDHAMILNLMLSKIAINLKVYGSCDDIITQTLNLFQVWPCNSLHTRAYNSCHVSQRIDPKESCMLPTIDCYGFSCQLQGAAGPPIPNSSLPCLWCFS